MSAPAPDPDPGRTAIVALIEAQVVALDQVHAAATRARKAHGLGSPEANDAYAVAQSAADHLSGMRSALAIYDAVVQR